MTDLYDGRITDFLPTAASYNPEVKALAYAILQEKRRIIDETKKTRTISVIEELPEQILDVLAVELRAPAYNESYPIETKRALIKGILTFYGKLGTPSAINWALQTAFGQGSVLEWFEYNGDHHCFRIVNLTPAAVENGLDTFLRLLQTVKRQSAVLDKIQIGMKKAKQILRVGVGYASISTCYVLCRVPSGMEVVYLTDENDDILADETGSRFIDTEEE